MRRAPLFVAGLIFSLVGILNLARTIWEVPIKVGTLFTLAPWTGMVAFVVMSLLAIWMFASLRGKDNTQIKQTLDDSDRQA